MKILTPSTEKWDLPQWRQVERRLDSIVANSAQSGTAEQIHEQVTIPANLLEVGQTLRIIMYGNCTGTGALTPRLRLGPLGTTADAQIGNLTSAASITPILNHAARVEFQATVRAIGASGVAALACNMSAMMGNSAVVAGQQINLATVVTTGIDTTVQNILSITMSQATAANFAMTTCVTELI